MNKYYKPLTLVIAFLILSLVTVASFAYFSASVQGNDNAYETVITTGEMALMLNDGEQIGFNNAIPGDSITKEFSVKNTGTVETTYDVYFSELINLFEDKNDLVYTLTSDNGCADGTEKIMPGNTGNQSKFISTCMISPNQTHNYTLTITFKDDETNQDDNQGKQFKTKISVNEYETVAYLKDGLNFNESIKNLMPEDSNDNSENNIKGLFRSDQEPDGNVDAVNIATESSDEEVLMWLDNDQIYLYSNANDIFCNEDSHFMFVNLRLKELNLSVFNTSLVKNMYGFFELNSAESIIFGDNFNTSNVTNMSWMFANVHINELLDLTNIDFSNVTDMSYMFYHASFNNIDFGNFNAEKVLNMYGMFESVEIPVLYFGNNFNAKSVIDMRYMFNGVKANYIDFGENFNVASDAKVGYMFNNTTGDLDLGDNFNGSLITSTSHMFDTTFLSSINMNSFDTSNVRDASYMFNNIYYALTSLDLGEKFNTSNMINLQRMFSYCSKLEELYLGNRFIVNQDVEYYGLFFGAHNLKTIYVGKDSYVYPSNISIFSSSSELVGASGTTYDLNQSTAEYARIDDPEHGKPGYFTLDPRYQ